jgi:hypothetical protein
MTSETCSRSRSKRPTVRRPISKCHVSLLSPATFHFSLKPRSIPLYCHTISLFVATFHSSLMPRFTPLCCHVSLLFDAIIAVVVGVTFRSVATATTPVVELSSDQSPHGLEFQMRSEFTIMQAPPQEKIAFSSSKTCVQLIKKSRQFIQKSSSTRQNMGSTHQRGLVSKATPPKAQRA